MADGRSLSLLKSTDDTPLIVFGSSCYYEMSEDENARFWSIFSDVRDAMQDELGASAPGEGWETDTISMAFEKGQQLIVVNCKEYISLRSSPDRAASRLTNIPLAIRWSFSITRWMDSVS